MNKVFLIYSQFSPYCKDLIDILTKLEDVNTLCIDNPKLRQQVLKSKNYNITVVPTVIHISDTNTFLYEGDKAKNFILNIFNNQYDEKNNQVETIEPSKTSIEDIIFESENESIPQPTSPTPQPTSQPGKTSIEDIFEEIDINESDDEEEEKSLMDKVEEMKMARGHD
jgi:hypothetical protein